ncbi:MAG: transcription antitermination factor NusB [Desulfonatronovibrionaceae bacterium]
MSSTSSSKPVQSGSRRSKRTYAFQVLYAHNFVPGLSAVEKTFELFQDNIPGGGPLTDGFAWSLVAGVLENLQKLDSIISTYSKNWKIQRIARIELTILRLAVYEMLFCRDIPLKVAINEAIELTKAFGDDNSRNFVNGILDAVARDIKNDKFGISKGF